MKRYILGIYLLLGTLFLHAQLPMNSWKLHMAYNYVNRVEMAKDKVYALSEGALFSVDCDDRSIETYNRITGLNGNSISEIKYIPNLNTLFIAYQNGYIDLLTDDGIWNIPDLYNTQLSISKAVRHISIAQQRAYLSMDFGIVVVNLDRQEIADTYYIGENASEVKVTATAITNTHIYAIGENQLYYAPLKANLVDYSVWKTRQDIPGTGDVQQIESYNNNICLLRNNALYIWNGTEWQLQLANKTVRNIRVSGRSLFAIGNQGAWKIDKDFSVTPIDALAGAADIACDATHPSVYWFAATSDGVGCMDAQRQEFNAYRPEGPLTNTAYRMRFQGKRLYIVPGGYLGVFYDRAGAAMYYEEGTWRNYPQSYFQEKIGLATADYSDIIGDPTDPSHFYIASFGYGLIECRNNEFYKRYMPDNSGLEPVIASTPEKYTWVDGFSFDNDGNLWMINTSTNHVKVLTSDGQWIKVGNQAFKGQSRAKNLMIDPKNHNIKYLIGAYSRIGISVLDDRGTINDLSDDTGVFHGTFVDGDNNLLTPELLPCAAFDLNGALWLGTKNGVLKFDNPQQLLQSNTCTRIKIAREDGSGLADYLLNDEQINAIAVDGVNRLWFGTENSGVYLMDVSDPQNIVTIHHFTSDNSALPSNTILSIAINPVTGEVFFGTGGGLVSYQSDAALGADNYSNAYAYPNPIRPDYEGVITIAGLMENTQVRITDNAGNLVYETKSNGSLAVWDGKNGNGKRVSSGVYMAMCVNPSGEHTLVKILVMQ